jgi:glycosyltransferase involved in cell wall biosynthesis
LASRDKLQERVRRFESFPTNATGGKRLQVGFLGSLPHLHKAPDVLLHAAAICLREGLDFDVAIAGDGKYRGMLEKMAADLGIQQRIRFLGALSPGEQVQQFLDQTDLFVLPSRSEGLPRVMVEAMARACPCIGSTVGGIPELLAPENLVAPGDARQLAARIREVLSEHGRMALMSQRNWEKAMEYQPAALEQRRLAFYRKVRELAQPSVKPDCRVSSS